MRRSLGILVLAAVILLASAPMALATFTGFRGLIAFQENGAIWVTSGGGGSVTFIARGSDPAWSPDGMRIAYQGEDGHIWMMRPDGTDKIRLTPDGAGGGAPSWSPDGRRIAYASRSKIYVLTLGDGGAPVPVTQSGGPDLDPAWSPTDDRIAFSRPDSVSDISIWTVRPDGSDERRITFADREHTMEFDQIWHRYPDWSPGGERLLYARQNRALETPAEIVSIFPDGTDPRALKSLVWGWSAQWAPEGNGLITTSYEEYYSAYTIESVGLDPSFTGGIEYVSPYGQTFIYPLVPTYQSLAPPPQVTGASGSLVAGSAGATVAVEGARFVHRSVVRWNGADRPTTYHGPTRLVALLSAADLATPGSGRVSAYTSPSGGGLSPGLPVTIAPGPPPPPAPKMTLASARFVVSWRESRPRGRLLLTGSLERGGTVEVALLTGARRVMRTRMKLGAGRFSRAVNLGGRLLPGRYRVRLEEARPAPPPAALTTAIRAVVLEPPPEGVVARASMSTTGPEGPAVVRKAFSRKLFARFDFAARPRRGRIVTEWYRDGAFVPGTRITRPYAASVGALVRSSARLPAGSWRCVVRVGPKVLANARVRLG